MLHVEPIARSNRDESRVSSSVDAKHSEMESMKKIVSRYIVITFACQGMRSERNVEMWRVHRQEFLLVQARLEEIIR